MGWIPLHWIAREQRLLEEKLENLRKQAEIQEFIDKIAKLKEIKGALINAGADTKTTDILGLTPDETYNKGDEQNLKNLRDAIECSDLYKVMCHIARGADINHEFGFGDTPLTLALNQYTLNYYGYTLVKFLICRKANVNLGNRPPLCIVSSYISGPLPFFSKNLSAFTIRWGIRLFYALLEHGAEPSICAPEKITALHILCGVTDEQMTKIDKNEGKKDVIFSLVDALLQKSPNALNALDDYLRPPISWAITSYNISIVQFLLNKPDIKLNFMPQFGNPLDVANFLEPNPEDEATAEEIKRLLKAHGAKTKEQLLRREYEEDEAYAALRGLFG